MTGIRLIPAKEPRRQGRYDWDARNRMAPLPLPKASEYRQGLTRQQWRRGEQLDAKEDRSNAKKAKAEERRFRAAHKLGEKVYG